MLKTAGVASLGPVTAMVTVRNTSVPRTVLGARGIGRSISGCLTGCLDVGIVRAVRNKGRFCIWNRAISAGRAWGLAAPTARLWAGVRGGFRVFMINKRLREI